VLRQIDEFNRSDAVHGILVQLPLPAHLDQVRFGGAEKWDIFCLLDVFLTAKSERYDRSVS
jgi:hypothetical protein